jgi:hypothetical protein
VLETYVAEIKEAIDRYGATAFVLEARISFELRPGGQCHLEGAVTFADQSALHFREFLDQTGNTLEKVMYVYHYQTDTGTLLFRYDNARHRPALPFEEHKHTPDEITPVEAPNLIVVLEEASQLGGWL